MSHRFDRALCAELSPDIEPVLTAWELWADAAGYESRQPFSPGATEQEIARVELKLGRSLPQELRALYRLTNGLSVLEGNINIAPLEGGQPNNQLVTMSAQLRKWEWPIPDELVLFGDNGGDDVFGAWIPRSSHPARTCLVVGTGEASGLLAIYGTTLARFLRASSAVHLCDNPGGALNALGVPGDLRDPQMPDEAVAAIFRWADPDLPHVPPDWSTQRLTTDQVSAFFRQRAG